MQDDFDDGTMELPDDISGGAELPDAEAGGDVDVEIRPRRRRAGRTAKRRRTCA